MTARDGFYVCTGCGERAEFLNEDGSRAVFERAGPPSRLNAGIIALVLALLAVAGLAGFAALHFDLLSRFRAAPVVAEAAPPVPEIRTGLAARFDPELRGNLIASFGTPGDDEIRGLALFADARIGALLLSGGEAPALHFVSVDGTEALVARRIPFKGALRAASLAAGPEDLGVVLIADDDGLRLSALGPGGENLWDQAWPGQISPAQDIALAADQGSILVLTPGETAATYVAAMLDAGGGRVWQRTFASGAGPGAQAALDADGVWLTFPLAEATGLRLMRLSRAGETVLDTVLAIEPERVGGLQPGPAGSGRLFVTGPVPQVLAIAPSGERLWEAEVRSALLQDRAALLGGPDGQVVIASAYRLSDVQTDLAVTQLGASGDVRSERILRLPAGTDLGEARAISGQRLLVAGSTAEAVGNPRDAFLLAVEVSRAAGEVSEALAPPPRVEVLKPAAASGAPAAAPEAGGALETPRSVACTFTCVSSGEALTVTQQVFAGDAEVEAGLRGIQAVICQASGAAPDLAVKPACGAGP